MGTIDSNGLYTAPAAIPPNTTITVTAAVQNTSATASATVTLISIFGAVVASLGARDLVRLLEVCGAAAGLVAVGAFIYGSALVTRETSIVARVLQQRAGAMA